MSNRNLWIIGGVLALGVLALIFMDMTRTSERPISNSMSDIVDSAKDGMDEFKEEVKDEIDDNTDAR